MRRLPLFALACAVCLWAGATSPASACVNTFKSEILRLQAMGDTTGVARLIGGLESDYQREPSLEHTNDLAVARILTKRYAEAIELLEEAEKRFPGKAIIAANLGTAHELAGRDAEALRWIREGVSRDSTEHFGTEWLHVKILEAKLAVARDPAWLDTNTVLGVGFGEGAEPVMPVKLPVDDAGRERTPTDVSTAIGYQLHERTQFVEPPDPIVADLYAAQGDLIYAIGKPTTMDEYLGIPTDSYEAALIYGPVHRKRVELRKQHFDANYNFDTWMPAFKPIEPTVDPHLVSRRRFIWMWTTLLLAASGLGIYLVWRRALRKP